MTLTQNITTVVIINRSKPSLSVIARSAATKQSRNRILWIASYLAMTDIFRTENSLFNVLLTKSVIITIRLFSGNSFSVPQCMVFCRHSLKYSTYEFPPQIFFLSFFTKICRIKFFYTFAPTFMKFLDWLRLVNGLN
jgi:hypothetical protein